MRRARGWATGLALCCTLLEWASRAHAHGVLPAATAPLAMDAEGVRLVRLNVGLAQRNGAGFRFLCPTLWGGDETAPAATIPSGPTVIAAPTGLFLVNEQGEISPHPQAQIGRTYMLASSAEALYGLMAHEPQSQLVRIDADTVEPLFADPARLTTLRAGQGAIQLVGVEDSSLNQILLSPQGVEQARTALELTERPLFAEARMQDGRPLILLGANLGESLQLGELTAGEFRVLAQAQNVLAGPLRTAQSSLLIVDGQLQAFAGSLPLALAETEYVSCLGEFEGQVFACVHDGLRALSDEGLGAPLFRWSQLQEPDLARVPAELRSDCLSRWYHLAVDLTAAGLMLPGPAADAGAAPDASVGGDAPGKATSSCSLRAPASTGARWNALGWVGLGLCILKRRGPRGTPRRGAAL